MIRLLVAADLHGSNACFKKCLWLADEISADILILAGDFTGKYYIPYVRTAHGSVELSVGDGIHKVEKVQNIDKWKVHWSDVGGYPVELHGHKPTLEEIRQLETRAAVHRITQWFDYGLREYSTLPVIAIPGNDDGPEVTRIIETHKWVMNVDNRVKKCKGYFFFGIGYSNFTPWKTPRELSEEKIGNLLSGLGKTIDRPGRSIGVIHVPPRDSGLDMVPELRRLPNGSLEATGNESVPCGSTAVRAFIESFGPLLVASGHCHTSAGIATVGKTVCVNPGSAFNCGQLKARLIVIDGDKVIDQLPLVR